MPVKVLVTHPMFIVGLGLRLLLVMAVLPSEVTEWYVAFVELSAHQFSADPWGLWISQGGDLAAFPYGYATWLALLPLTFVCIFLGLPLHLGYSFTLLAADFALLLAFRQLLSGRDRLLLAAYWLSPIVLIASYVLGFNDLLPVLFLVLSILWIRNLRFFLAGFFCILAVSAKLSMLLALPFIAVYLLRSRALYTMVPRFLQGLVVGAILLILPFAFSVDAMRMLWNNPELGRVYRSSLTVGEGVSVYVIPLLYLIMLYGAWRIRRMNFDLFQSILGVAFLLVVLLAPGSWGWFIWTIPLLVSYLAFSDKVATALGAAFSAIYVLSVMVSQPAMGSVSIQGLGEWSMPAILEDPRIPSLFHTALVAVGALLALRIWREMVSRNDYFRLSRRPFVIGIAGDSGSGKDTLADALQGLFGSHSVTRLSGDDYHLWDRQKPIWQVMTHLNPMANDLEGYVTDLVSLIDGRTILKRHYDHQTGVRGEKVKLTSNDLIIASGLHALYLPLLRRCFNLSIYLDIDESLRRFLKQARDTSQRGHSIEQVLSAFSKREPDSEKFIRPQSAHADLVLSLQPIHPSLIEQVDLERPLRFKLVARSRNGLNELSLARVLVGVCGLHVDVITSVDSLEVELTVEGETSAEDVALAAQMLFPRVLEFLDINPKWLDGALGLMQLIVLSHVNQALTRRFL